MVVLYVQRRRSAIINDWESFRQRIDVLVSVDRRAPTVPLFLLGGIIHTHSPSGSTFACLGGPIEAAHYLIAYADDAIPVVSYETDGTEALGRIAAETLGETYNVCLLDNHGVLTVGETIEGAFETALMVEYCARFHHQARAIGEPKSLPDEEGDRVVEGVARSWTH